MAETNLIVSDIDFIQLMAMGPPPDLRAELERATVVPADSIRADVVTIGSRVRYCDQETGNVREIEIVFPADADPACGKVSVIAPVGAALIGLCEGQDIDWIFPNGSAHRLTVIAVTQPPLRNRSESPAPH